LPPPFIPPSGTGNQTINGDGGNNNLFGGNGNDAINGNGGNDRASGSGGADTIDGGDGNDTVLGGAGADRFIFREGGDDDYIGDFVRGQDRIVLDVNIGSTPIGSFTQLLLRIGQGSVSTSSGNGALTVNFDNSDTLVIQGITNLQSGDWIFI
jgi:Ca2+-binding RTX toxin-like protein